MGSCQARRTRVCLSTRCETLTWSRQKDNTAMCTKLASTKPQISRSRSWDGKKHKKAIYLDTRNLEFRQRIYNTFQRRILDGFSSAQCEYSLSGFFASKKCAENHDLEWCHKLTVCLRNKAESWLMPSPKNNSLFVDTMGDSHLITAETKHKVSLWWSVWVWSQELPSRLSRTKETRKEQRSWMVPDAKGLPCGAMRNIGWCQAQTTKVSLSTKCETLTWSRPKQNTIFLCGKNQNLGWHQARRTRVSLSTRCKKLARDHDRTKTLPCAPYLHRHSLKLPDHDKNETLPCKTKLPSPKPLSYRDCKSSKNTFLRFALRASFWGCLHWFPHSCVLLCCSSCGGFVISDGFFQHYAHLFGFAGSSALIFRIPCVLLCWFLW